MTDQYNTECEGVVDEDSQPLCLQCLTPFEPLQHYCSSCGGTVGEFTRYIPFVNIPFYAEFLGKIWQKFWRSNAGVMKKIGLFIMVIIFWGPLLFLAGTPFELWRKYKK